MRYIILNIEEIETLETLHQNSMDRTIRNRSQCILLSHQRRTITDLASVFGVNRRTIERWFHGWDKNGIDSLHIQAGRGVKTRLQGYEKEIAEQLKEHNRNLKNVLTYLKEQHKIVICKKTLQNFLKGNGL